MQTDPNGNLRRVGSLSLWDLQGSYSGFKNLKLMLGVKNVFDTNPPLTNAELTFQAATIRRTTTRVPGFVYARAEILVQVAALGSQTQRGPARPPLSLVHQL